MDAALQHIDRAQELEPLGWVPPSMAAVLHRFRGELAKSRELLDRSEKMLEAPTSFQIQLELFYALSSHNTDLARHILAIARSSPSEWARPANQKLVEVMDQALAY